MTKLSPNPISDKKLPPVYLGLPVWQHASWPTCWFDNSKSRTNQLEHYAKYFNSIEGNTTFYSTPSIENLKRWHDSVPDDFRFTFKLHQSISHQARLQHVAEQLEAQLMLLSSLGEKLGLVMLQLPTSFGPDSMALLEQFVNEFANEFVSKFVDKYAKRYPLAIEVRHPGFFDKQDAEIQFNRLLVQHQVNRIMMDTRALNCGPETSDILVETRRKKPSLPLHVIATSNHPVVRFVGNDNEQDNALHLTPWVHKIHQWRQQGKTPYMFLHRPDNKDAPWLAAQFIDMYNRAYPDAVLPSVTFPTKAQQSLF